jgi:hypothetical protein
MAAHRLIVALLLLCIALPTHAQPQPDPPSCSFFTSRAKDVAELGGVYVATWVCPGFDRYAGWAVQQAAWAPLLQRASAVQATKRAALAGDFAALVALRDRPLSAPEFTAARAKALQAFTPPPGPWVVAANGSLPDRPMRGLLTFGDGLSLAGALPMRAVVGRTCDCARRVLAGTVTWCAVPTAAAGGAAVCREVAP